MRNQHSCAGTEAMSQSCSNGIRNQSNPRQTKDWISALRLETRGNGFVIRTKIICPILQLSWLIVEAYTIIFGSDILKAYLKLKQWIMKYNAHIGCTHKVFNKIATSKCSGNFSTKSLMSQKTKILTPKTNDFNDDSFKMLQKCVFNMKISRISKMCIYSYCITQIFDFTQHFLFKL